jgi:hypothetical protein
MVIAALADSLKAANFSGAALFNDHYKNEAALE